MKSYECLQSIISLIQCFDVYDFPSKFMIKLPSIFSKKIKFHKKIIKCLASYGCSFP